jgi:alkaline phosphatase D
MHTGSLRHKAIMPMLRSVIAALLVSLCLTAQGAQLTTVATPQGHTRLASGPMPGHSAMRAVTIWLQATGAGEVTLDYWPEGQAGHIRSTAPVTLSPEQQYTAHIEIGALEPGSRYEYRLQIDGKPQAIPQRLTFQTQPLWQWRNEPPSFSLVAGSCAYINEAAYDRPGKPYGDKYGIFERIAERSPDMMLWLGDNVYLREADYDSRWGMAERYRHTRALPSLQPLLRSSHHYAIWDDHDYGPDRSNHSFTLKDQSLALFKRYWANPTYGLAEGQGIFTHFSFRDIDFFLLDDRWYRNSDAAPDADGKTMLGRRQLEWLKDALLGSTAPFKVIASGSQMLNRFSGKESWSQFPNEQSAFLDWLQETGVPGVLFLSGDAHYSALSVTERNGHYPLYELVCSPLTAGPRRIAFEPGRSELVPGTRVDERNFCQLEFSGPGKARRLTITVFDADGKSRWVREIVSNELR